MGLQHSDPALEFNTLKVLRAARAQEGGRSFEAGSGRPGGVGNRETGNFQRTVRSRQRGDGRLPAIYGNRFEPHFLETEFAKPLFKPFLHLKTLRIARPSRAESDDAPDPGEHHAGAWHAKSVW